MKALLFGLSILIIAILLWVWFAKDGSPHLIKTYKSPLTEHSIEVWVNNESYSSPGDAWSGEGFVLLKNGAGNVLEKKSTELVISVEEPRWFGDRVEVKLFAEWSLRNR